MDFNKIQKPNEYLPGTQYNAAGGDDLVILPFTNENAWKSGFAYMHDFHGSGGNDTIIGGNLMDHIFGDSGDDHLFGGNAKDYLNGGTGHDQIDGGNGADDLNGAAGDDLLIGGEGRDIMEGGIGNDMFSFDKFQGAGQLETADVILNFEDNVDKIELLNLSFDQLDIVNVGNDCVIFSNQTNQYVCVIKDAAGQIDVNDFIF